MLSGPILTGPSPLIRRPAINDPAPALVKDDQAVCESLQQPLWHVVVLAVLTCSAYLFYWFYKNWRDLSAQAGRAAGAGCQLSRFENVSPLLRVIGLVVPVLNIYLAATQIKGIAELVPNSRSFPRRHPLLASALVVGGIIVLQLLSRLPGPLFLLSFSACLPLACAQHWLNDYWRSVESPGLPVRYAFTIKEMVVIIAGSLWLGLVLAGFFLA